MFTDFHNKNESRRAVWIENTLKKIPKGRKILDAGAGECQFKKFCGHLKYYSQDFLEYTGKGDKKGLQTDKWDYSKIDFVSDITSIPKPNGFFDAIMCTEVFEHVPDPLSALREFSRLLKRGGYLLTTAPFCSLTHFSPYHYYSGFSTYFYKHNYPKFGFKIVDLQVNGNYFEYLAQEASRLPDVISTYSRSEMSPLDSLINKFYISLLQKYSKRSRKSQELLYFDCHVLAQKVR